MSGRSVSVVVEDPRGRVLLLLRGPTAPWMPNRWNLPGGGVESGESPREAARREVLEEAGLYAGALSTLTRVGGLDVFYADHWTGRVQLLDREHTRAAWVPREVAWTWDLVPSHREVLRHFAGA